MERRLTTTERRIDQAAVMVGELNRRVASLGQKMARGRETEIFRIAILTKKRDDDPITRS